MSNHIKEEIIKKLKKVFGIFFEDLANILNFMQNTEKACKQKVSFL
jgi:hypothetical protein